MKKADIIKLAKVVKKKAKAFAPQKKPYVSYSRRIECVKTNKRICAMTFDDGPTKSDNLTSNILDILSEFGAKGTFDIIGTTENNYPDTQGVIGTPTWSGNKYDHYPNFGSDILAGAVNCNELLKRIIAEGHEITNHTFSHVLFGKKNVIYSKRNTLKNYDEVYKDVKKLHDILCDRYGYEMKFSRPPHYVDSIKGGFSSYDVYSEIGYNYLAASFDGAGWLPCDTLEKEVEAMVEPLKKALSENPDALSGQIIFQKDGYNMCLRAPVIKGLREQLKLLMNYGYKIVTVSELLQESPFGDVGRDDPDFELFYSLQSEKAIVYNNNYLMPDKDMTRGELAILLAPKEFSVNRRIDFIKSCQSLPYSLKPKNPYSGALMWAIDNNLLTVTNGKSDGNKKITIHDVEKLSMYLDVQFLSKNPLTRRNIFKALK